MESRVLASKTALVFGPAEVIATLAREVLVAGGAPATRR
jgi:hypothetical protein